MYGKILCKICLLLLLVGSVGAVNGQRYVAKNGNVKLKYKAPHGAMAAENKQVNVGFDSKTGAMQFNIVMLAFHFDGAFSQEQFNAYFKKNAHFANSSFKGKIVDFQNINLSKNGEYDVWVEGKFTFRRTTSDMSAKAKFIVKDNKLLGRSVFVLNLKDYNIKLAPTMNETIEVHFNAELNRL
ncbi:MAG: hypothetical protein PHU27_07180 [Salinivirgaceae bacterium]|nr:hypothetical protein [Salinivirgaceae bacterium]MDD4747797.1 hypothetical protein [Salinivirgaceae bacterium]MDY0281705.1 hypothetical protein [Salinivirgaceae bacterium]